MKYLGKKKYCLSLQTEHKTNEVLIYVEIILKRFNIGTHPLIISMVVWSINLKKDSFYLKHDNE